eukprot:TRINITY_DN3458_c0_g1_i1.p1 TRINITY_DN3458_c0_g1~~TRINITY_DN3458_c0_g1_i1.p1  ORF type:complete len:957 (+),score=233.47 TRINITY_DN3458_c0_g1_i1:41-2872(+)
MATEGSDRSFNWNPRSRDFVSEQQKLSLKRGVTDSHPLKRAETVQPQQSQGKAAPAPAPVSVFFDPLQQREEETDPLSSTIASVLNSSAAAAAVQADDSDFVPWKARTSAILQRYTTSASIPVPDFVDNSLPRPASTTTDRVKARLEELDTSRQHEEAVLLQLNQADYIAHIQALNDELRVAWHNEERVKALKIVIQTSKCLADTSVPMFYPSMWVCVTEILDTFGELVWERLKRKALNVDPTSGRPIGKLPENFGVDDVSDEARETAKNWFYKIASVRELLPRLYVELAIVRCTRFMGAADISRMLLRHAAMIRGIGDPLIAAFARSYLIRVGLQGAPHAVDYMTTCIFDFLFTFQQHDSQVLTEYLQRYNLTREQYMDLYSPAVAWMFDCYARKLDADMFGKLLQQYKRFCNRSFVLQQIIASTSPALVSQYASELAVLARDADEASLPRDRVYMALGARLVEQAPNGRPLDVLNEVWKVVTKFTQPVPYMNVAQIWIEYPLKHLSMREVNVMMRDILAHVSQDHNYEQVQPQLQAVVQRILLKEGALEKALAMESFVGVVDLFQKEAKTSICLALMESFASGAITSDPVLVNAVFHTARSLHDSINSTSLQDERRQITNLIKSFIQKVDYGADFEQQLNFYVECRQSFANLDAIKNLLVRQSCSLAMRTLHRVNHNHNKRTLAFTKACLAYAHITIPSMTDVFGRLYLFLLAGEVALHNQLLSQADAFFKAAITLLPEVPAMLEEESQMRFTSETLSAFVASFLSLLVVVPGHPENGPLYLIHGLLTVIRQYPWEKGSDGKARALLNALSVLAALAQDKLPYHIPKIDSNDVLYGAEPEYTKELTTLMNTLADELMTELKALGDDPDKAAQRRQASLALDMFNVLVSSGQLDGKLATLAYNLFQLSKKGSAPEAYLRNSLSYISNGTSSLHKQLHAKLVQ